MYCRNQDSSTPNPALPGLQGVEAGPALDSCTRCSVGPARFRQSWNCTVGVGEARMPSPWGREGIRTEQCK